MHSLTLDRAGLFSALLLLNLTVKLHHKNTQRTNSVTAAPRYFDSTRLIHTRTHAFTKFFYTALLSIYICKKNALLLLALLWTFFFIIIIFVTKLFSFFFKISPNFFSFPKKFNTHTHSLAWGNKFFFFKFSTLNYFLILFHSPHTLFHSTHQKLMR